MGKTYGKLQFFILFWFFKEHKIIRMTILVVIVEITKIKNKKAKNLEMFSLLKQEMVISSKFDNSIFVLKFHMICF